MPDVRLTAVKHIAQQVRGEHLRISEALDYLADVCGSISSGNVQVTNNIVNPPADTGWIREPTPDRTRTVDPALQVIIGQNIVPLPFRTDLSIVGLDDALTAIAVFAHGSATPGFGAFYSGYRSRGTAVAKTNVVAGDLALSLNANAWDGANWKDVGELKFIVNARGGLDDLSGYGSMHIAPSGVGQPQVEIQRWYSSGLNIGGTMRAPVSVVDIEVNTNSHAELPALVLRRMRADSTAPNAGFGAQIAWYLEGNTNGSEVLAAWMAASWEINQTNNTTTRDSFLRMVVMEDNVSIEVARYGTFSHLYQSMGDVSWIFKDSATFKTWTRYAFGATTPVYDRIIRGRGTSPSPAGMATGDILWDRETNAYDGVPTLRAGNLERVYIENFVGNDNFSTGWVLYLRPTGTAPSFIVGLHSTPTGLGVNTPFSAAAPLSRLHVVDQVQLIVHWDTHSSDGLGIIHYFRKSRGSATSPSTVSSGDGVWYFAPMAHDGTTYRQIALFSCEVDTRTGTDNLSGRLRFYTRPDGAAAALTERLQITKDGNFTVFGGYFEMDERSDPAAPAANKARLYTRDNGAGKTQLVVRFNSGAIQVIATEP